MKAAVFIAKIGVAFVAIVACGIGWAFAIGALTRPPKPAPPPGIPKDPPITKEEIANRFKK